MTVCISKNKAFRAFTLAADEPITTMGQRLLDINAALHMRR